MRLVTGIVILAAAAAATTSASAQGSRLTDVEFIKASRCAGLMSAETLGAADGAAFNALVKAQSRGREQFVLDRADSARKAALKAAARANEGGKTSLIAERDGVCKVFVS
jgi:hypothetical protein